MKTVTRFIAATLTAAALAIPTTAAAASPDAGGVVTRSTGSQLVAHFVTIDSTGCLRNDLFIHGVAPGAIDANVESFNLCTNALVLLTGGTNWNATVAVDEALQTGHAAGTIMTFDRSTGSPLAVTIDLSWSGYGGLATTALAPGLSPNDTGFHATTPYANVTYNGVLSIRSATMAGTIDVPGFDFPSSMAQPDLTSLSAGSSNFIIAFKP
jgi:hypothetical protein